MYLRENVFAAFLKTNFFVAPSFLMITVNWIKEKMYTYYLFYVYSRSHSDKCLWKGLCMFLIIEKKATTKNGFRNSERIKLLCVVPISQRWRHCLLVSEIPSSLAGGAFILKLEITHLPTSTPSGALGFYMNIKGLRNFLVACTSFNFCLILGTQLCLFFFFNIYNVFSCIISSW